MSDLLERARAVLETERDSACLLDSSGWIVYCNAAWDRFAVENGGAPEALARSVVGRRWADFLDGADVARELGSVLARALAGEPVSLTTECNAPTVGRLLHCQFQPVRAARGAPVEGVAIVHSVARSGPIEELHVPQPARDELYVHDDGLIRMCAACRRVRRAGAATDRWDFVPEYVKRRRANLSHGFCGTCFGIRYGALHLARPPQAE